MVYGFLKRIKHYLLVLGEAKKISVIAGILCVMAFDITVKFNIE